MVLWPLYDATAGRSWERVWGWGANDSWVLIPSLKVQDDVSSGSEWGCRTVSP